MKKIISLIVAAMLMCVAFSGCTDKNKTDNKTNNVKTEDKATQSEDKKETANAENPLENQIPIEIDLEDGGVIKAVLYPDIAPNTVENFVKLCRENFYDGLIFHRVIKGFMIQGGGYDENMNEKPAESIDGEFKSNGFNNRLKHTRGVPSMARTNDPNSGSSQFFIMHAAAPHLDGEYAAFGIVTEGIEEVDKIANCQTDANDQPEETQKIKTIKVLD